MDQSTSSGSAPITSSTHLRKHKASSPIRVASSSHLKKARSDTSAVVTTSIEEDEVDELEMTPLKAPVKSKGPGDSKSICTFSFLLVFLFLN